MMMPRWRTVLASFAFPLVVATIYFLSAGRLDLPAAWTVFGVFASCCVALALTADRGLVQERITPGPGNRDRVTRPVAIVLLLIHWIVAGLDVGRFQWSTIPPPVQYSGALVYAVAMLVLLWAMCSNPFYSSVVRVQHERGHRTIATGPYRFVRHPGYAATLCGVAAGGLALGSWLAMLPLAVLGVLFFRRTLVEDRMLMHELPGYAEYAKLVPYRLLRGVF
jgi:protein-S-isoprenylcysteine O-methyltransferase Ste14